MRSLSLVRETLYRSKLMEMQLKQGIGLMRIRINTKVKIKIISKASYLEEIRTFNKA